MAATFAALAGAVLVLISQLLPTAGRIFLLDNIAWGVFGVIAAAAAGVGILLGKTQVAVLLSRSGAAGVGLYWVLIIVPAVYSNGWASMVATLGTAATLAGVWIASQEKV